MSFATRMWARRLVNAASINTTARTSFLRPRSMPVKTYQPWRTMATAANQQVVNDIPVTTISEDQKEYGDEFGSK
jgi:hypothetical protein